MRQRDQAPGFVVAALAWQEVAEQAAAQARDDAAPILGLAAELLALEGIDVVTDEAGDAHGTPSCLDGSLYSMAGARCFG